MQDRERPNVDKLEGQKEYRKKLANELRTQRAKGEVWKLLALDNFEKESDNEHYILSKYGYTGKSARILFDYFLQKLKKEPHLNFRFTLLVHNIEKFSDVDLDIAEYFINEGMPQVVGARVGVFKFKNDNEFVEMVLKSKYGIRSIAINLRDLHNLDRKYATMLIKAGCAKEVEENVNSFKK